MAGKCTGCFEAPTKLSKYVARGQGYFVLITTQERRVEPAGTKGRLFHIAHNLAVTCVAIADWQVDNPYHPFNSDIRTAQDCSQTMQTFSRTRIFYFGRPFLQKTTRLYKRAAPLVHAKDLGILPVLSRLTRFMTNPW